MRDQRTAPVERAAPAKRRQDTSAPTRDRSLQTMTPVAGIYALQGQVGNAAVTQLLRKTGRIPSPRPAKARVAQPGSLAGHLQRAPLDTPQYQLQIPDEHYALTKQMFADRAGFDFDDDAGTLDVFLSYQQINETARELKQIVGLMLEPTRMTATEADFEKFKTDDARQFDGAMAKGIERESLRMVGEFDFSSYDAKFPAGKTELIAEALAGRSAVSASEYLLSVVEQDAILIGEDHGEGAGIAYLRENLHALVDAGVQTIYAEYFRPEYQPDIDAFLDNPGSSLSLELSAFLESIQKLNGPNSLLALLAHARTLGVHVRCMDSRFAGREGDGEEELFASRARKMNFIAREMIAAGQNINPDGKFVVLCGEAHLHTHAPGIPGLAQLLGTIAVTPAADGTLTVLAEDRANRNAR